MGIDFLLSRDPSVTDYPMGYGTTSPPALWFKPGFPSGYGADPRLTPALDWVASQQDDQGRWPNRNAYSHKTVVDFEPQGKPSKWVTLRACSVLARAS